MNPESCQKDLTGDIDMINVCLVPRDVLHQESAWLFDLFDKIKLFAALGQAGEDEEERVLHLVGNLGPDRRNGYVLSVDELRSRAGGGVYQISGFPDTNQHVFPLVSKITMHIHEGVVECRCVNVGECLDVHFRFSHCRQLPFFTDSAGKVQVHKGRDLHIKSTRDFEEILWSTFAANKKELAVHPTNGYKTGVTRITRTLCGRTKI